MSFDVQPEDLRSFGKQVKRAAEDVQAGKKYAKTHGDAVEQSEGVLNTHLNAVHPQVVAKVDKVLDRVHKLLASAAGELERSAGYYEKTDRDEARRQDATYPVTKR